VCLYTSSSRSISVQIATGLHVDQLERDFSSIRYPVDGADGMETDSFRALRRPLGYAANDDDAFAMRTPWNNDDIANVGDPCAPCRKPTRALTNLSVTPYSNPSAASTFARSMLAFRR
jgi:hypothetical protein